jgi:hypothetical protein
MRNGLWTIVAALGAVIGGCGAASQDELRTRAAYEMKCPSDQLQLTDLGGETTGVDGCGQRQVYVESCEGQGALRECKWVMNSHSK